jgi:hypothetical protein
MPGWQLPQGAQQINAVRVTSKWNGETAVVRVTLLRGVKFYDEEEEVSLNRMARSLNSFQLI